MMVAYLLFQYRVLPLSFPMGQITGAAHDTFTDEWNSSAGTKNRLKPVTKVSVSMLQHTSHISRRFSTAGNLEQKRRK
jgi:hypothetical protein